MRRLLDVVLRLFPARFRRRHRQQVRGTLADGLSAERDPRRRRLLVRRALVDALATLPRAWADAFREAGARAGAELGRDVGFALRHLRLRPLRTATLVATLGFALGAATAIGSVTWAILLRALPYEDPGRVFAVEPTQASFTAAGLRLDPDFLAHPEVEAAALYIPDGAAALTLDDGSPARRIAVAQVSEGFFRTLGVRLRAGAGLDRSEGDVPDRVVVSHDLWQGAFGADPDLIGRTVRLNDRPLTVVGIAPPEVVFPGRTEAWLPLPEWFELFGSAVAGDVVARVRGGAAVETLTERITAGIQAEWADVPAERGAPPTAVLRPLRDELTRGLRTPLGLLVTAAAAILVLACLNLAGIELAAVGARVRELRVRTALGASRGRIVRQLLTESLVLAAAGGAAGLLLAWGGIRALRAMLPGETPGLAAAALDPRVLAAAAALTVAAGLAVGSLPAVRAGGRPERGGAGRSVTPGLDGRRLQGALVVGQVALALVLAAGAGLLGSTLTRLEEVPVGYDTEGVLTFEVRFPDPRSDEREAWFGRVRDRIRALPGVTAVGASTRLPLSSGLGIGRRFRAGEGGEEGTTLTWIEATDEWLEAMGIPRAAGGDVPPAFTEEAGVVLTRSAADTLFGGAPAVGRTVQAMGWDREWQDPVPVLGVVEDLRLDGAASPARRIVIAGFRHANNFGVAVRTSGDPAALAPAVREVLADVDPTLAPYAFRTTAEALSAQMAARTAVARLAGLFGSVALLLTALGLYGLVARTIEARRAELGIRLALGASPSALLARTVAAGLALGALGVGLGLAIFLPLAGRLEELLFGVGAREPAVLAPVVLVVLAVTALAAWLPARATTRLDPREALTADA